MVVLLNDWIFEMIHNPLLHSAFWQLFLRLFYTLKHNFFFIRLKTENTAKHPETPWNTLFFGRQLIDFCKQEGSFFINISEQIKNKLPNETESFLLGDMVDGDLFKEAGGCGWLARPEHVYLEANLDLLGEGALGEHRLHLQHTTFVRDRWRDWRREEDTGVRFLSTLKPLFFIRGHSKRTMKKKESKVSAVLISNVKR